MVMDSIRELNWRYATKKFDPDKVLSEQKLQILKRAFNLTPLSYGLQTLKLVIITDRALRRQLVPLCWDQPQVADASQLLILCVQTEIGEADVTAHFDNIQRTRNAPEEILAPYRERLKTHLASRTAAQNRDWAVRQAYIALGTLLTVCAYEHIDACPMEGFESTLVDEFLDLARLQLQSVLLLPVGYRAEDDPFQHLKKVRKSLDSVIIER